MIALINILSISTPSLLMIFYPDLYGCIVTGDVIVFLRNNDYHATILNYHAAEPTLEVGEGKSHPTRIEISSSTQCLKAYPKL